MAIAVAVVVAWLLLKPNTLTDERAEIAAVQVVATIGVGVGGLGTLMLFVRRQWLQEQAHELDRERADLDRQIAEDNRIQADRQHERELVKAADDRHDATERRITELYMTAVEQLGHDKVSVRLAALHALDRLGQNEANHRKVIIDIWCSYLRQPHPMPSRLMTLRQAEIDGGFPEPASGTSIDPADLEYEVRVTAQRLLASHLKDSRGVDERFDEPPPVEPHGFWGPSSIDLTGARLVDADFSGCWLPEARFINTRFHGGGDFSEAQLGGDVRFDGAKFHGYANFSKAWFGGDAYFDIVDFDEFTRFTQTTFTKAVWFEDARFARAAWFENAQFHETAGFPDAQFGENAAFTAAQFHGKVWFTEVQFGRLAEFDNTRFGESAAFSRAQFGKLANLTGARFDGRARFTEAQFGEGVALDKVIAVLDPGKESHEWPPGWVLVPDPESEPGWGPLGHDSTSPD